MAEDIRNTNEVPPSVSGRLPIGLTMSMGVAACSLAAMLLLWNLRWPSNNPFEHTVHVSAGLCLGWGVLAHLLQRLRPGWLSGQIGRDLLAVLNVMQLVLALLVGVIMLYLAAAAVLTRIPSLPFFSFRPDWQVRIWTTGSVDVALVGMAALLAWWRSGNGAVMTGLMWLLVLMSLWSSLRIPASIIREENGISQAVLVDWVSPFVFGAAISLGAFTVISGMLAHRRRLDAWPDRLDHLLSPPPEWAGFHYSAGIISVIVLILGCVFIVSPITPVAAIIAGVSVLALAHRSWNENYADTGLGLITLGVLSLFMMVVPDIRGNKAEYFAAIFSRALLGLGIMTAFWHWLARVWDQQLDAGYAWTTAGRLIRPCRRLGFLLGAIAVLVSLQLAFWPKLPNVWIADNTIGRWIWGILANLVLVGTLTAAARRTGKSTLAWLALCGLCSTLSFVVIRLAGTFIYSGFLEFWPIILAAAGIGMIWLAERAWRSTGWRAFHEPSYVVGLLVCPVVAIFGVGIIGSHAFPGWVAPATFAVLAGEFLFAALTTGPRRFLILTFVCATAAIWFIRA